MSKLLGIQYLRAIAALAVVVFHSANKEGFTFTIGEAGVDIFFVISGFLMMAITSEKTSPSKFIRDRVKRIVPLYWIATTVMLIGVVAGLFPNARLDTWHILASYLFIPAESPSSDFIWPLLIPGWTLNFEMAFYVVFAFSLWIKNQMLRVFALTGVIGGLALAGVLVEADGAILEFYMNQIIIEFVVGCWLGYAWNKNQQLFRYGVSLIALSVIVFIYVGFLNSDTGRAIIFGIPAALLIAGVLAIEARGAIGRLHIPLLLGNASYSIYIWHTLTISVTSKIGLILGLGDEVTIGLNVIGGVTFGLAAYGLLERPLLQLTRRNSHVPSLASAS